MIYSIDVIETRKALCNYTIEADSEEEALAKAQSGETYDESVDSCLEVLSREIVPNTLKVSDDLKEECDCNDCHADSYEILEEEEE